MVVFLCISIVCAKVWSRGINGESSRAMSCVTQCGMLVLHWRWYIFLLSFGIHGFVCYGIFPSRLDSSTFFLPMYQDPDPASRQITAQRGRTCMLLEASCSAPTHFVSCVHERWGSVCLQGSELRDQWDELCVLICFVWVVLLREVVAGVYMRAQDVHVLNRSGVGTDIFTHYFGGDFEVVNPWQPANMGASDLEVRVCYLWVFFYTNGATASQPPPRPNPESSQSSAQ